MLLLQRGLLLLDERVVGRERDNGSVCFLRLLAQIQSG
jgi:hypothetical protein